MQHVIFLSFPTAFYYMLRVQIAPIPGLTLVVQKLPHGDPTPVQVQNQHRWCLHQRFLYWLPMFPFRILLFSTYYDFSGLLFLIIKVCIFVYLAHFQLLCMNTTNSTSNVLLSYFLSPLLPPVLPVNISVPAAYAIDGFYNSFYFRGCTSLVGISNIFVGKPNSFPMSFGLKSSYYYIIFIQPSLSYLFFFFHNH